MRARTTIALVLAAIALAAVGVPASTERLILGMVLPRNTMWHKVITEMTDDWRRGTEGRVTVLVRDSAGEERTIVQRMRNDVFQAGALSAIGLTDIDRGFDVFGIPMFFDSHAELYHVVRALTPRFEERLEQRGFVLLGWGHVGWVQVFSTRPVRTVDDLKSVRLFTSNGDDEMVEWYKRHGFRPQALSVADVPMALQTKMLEAVPTTPLAALSFQWYGTARHMLRIGIAPLVGATVVTRKAWDRIGADDRTTLLAAARRMQDRLEIEVPRQDEQAVVAMQKRGLEVIAPEGAAAAEWRRAAEEFAESMRGSRVEPALFDEAVRARATFRESRRGSRS